MWLSKRINRHGVYFFWQKTGLGAIVTRKAGASVTEELSQEWHKLVIKKFETGKPMTGWKIMFGPQI